MRYLQLFVLLFFAVHLSAQIPELIVPAGHGDQVYLTKFSADGKYLFSVGTGSKSIKVWETKNGRLLKNLLVDDFPTCMQGTDDGKMLIVGTKNNIYFYAFPSFKLLHKTTLGALDAVTRGQFLYVLSAMGARTSSINLTDFKQNNSFDDNSDGEIISLSPKGDELFIEATFTSKILNTATGTITRTKDQEPGNMSIGYTPAGNIFGFNFSTKKKGDMVSVPQLKNASTLENMLNFNFKVPGSARLQSLKNQVVYAGNNLMCISGDGAIIIADYTNGKKISEIKTPGEDIICMAANGNMVVAGDKYKGTLKQYDLTTGKLIRVYGEDAIAPVVLETASNATGIVIDGMFDSPCGYFSAMPNGKITAAAFQKGAGELMSVVGISADATITATYNQKIVQLYKAPQFDKPYISFSLDDKNVAALGITPDNKKLVIVFKKYVAIYDVQTGNLIKEISNYSSYDKPKKNEYLNNERGFCSFSVNSRYVAVKADEVSVFDLEKYTTSGSIYIADILAVKLAEDGQKLYYLQAKTYTAGMKWCEFDVLNPKPPVETAINLSVDEIRVSDDDVQKINVAISPDLNLIAYVQNDEIGVYNRKESVNTAILKGHQSYVRQVRWLANGVLVSSGNDNTIRFWDVQKGVELAKLILFTNGGWVVVTPNGQFDASEDAMKKLYYVQGIETIPLDNLFEKFYAPNLLARVLKNDVLPVPDVDVNKLAAPPKVKMTFDVARNLVVGDDVPKLDWNNETISVKVNAESAENPIDEIRLYLNGKLIDGTSRNLFVADDDPKSVTKTFTIKLLPGLNSFKAIALNKQRTESQPDETDVNYIPAKNNPVPSAQDITLHLFVIGINNYKNPKYNLNYAKADATSFKAEMEKSNSLFAKSKVYFITDAEAMKDNIESTFKKIIGEAKPQDVFIFYYAGHGVMGTGDNKDFYIVPYDVTQLYGAEDALAQKGISAKELQDFSKNIPAQKQLFILDACQSAGALDAVAMRGAAEEKAIAQLARSTGSHWLTASGSDQFAAEFSQLGHGLFTYVLLQGLLGGADNGDKQVTVNELKAYLETQVPELSQKYKGAPQYPASYGYGNDFPLEIIK
ncbi:MAG: caspase family protein [Chitinophagaceae bacterium]